MCKLPSFYHFLFLASIIFWIVFHVFFRAKPYPNAHGTREYAHANAHKCAQKKTYEWGSFRHGGDGHYQPLFLTTFLSALFLHCTCKTHLLRLLVLGTIIFLLEDPMCMFWLLSTFADWTCPHCIPLITTIVTCFPTILWISLNDAQMIGVFWIWLLSRVASIIFI